MTSKPLFLAEVRPWFHEYFQFWPDHEDLIWAKSVWPIMEDAGFYANHDEEAQAWTKRHILALPVLYAESASRFGVPDYGFSRATRRQWLMIAFGSINNLDEVLSDVGSSVGFSFIKNQTCERDPGFFIPLVRSLVTGSGFHVEGPALEAYLARVEDRNFEMCAFREDELCRMWIGGHFAADELNCVY